MKPIECCRSSHPGERRRRRAGGGRSEEKDHLDRRRRRPSSSSRDAGRARRLTSVAVTRQRVQRPVTRPRPPVAERVASAGRRPPVPAPADLQRRLGNRGTTRLLARAAGELGAPVTPVRTIAPPLAATPSPGPALGPAPATAAVAPPDMVAGAPPGMARRPACRRHRAALRLAAGADGRRPGRGGAAARSRRYQPVAPPAAPAPARRRRAGAPAGAVAAPGVAGPGPEAVEAPAVLSAEEAVAPVVQAVAGRARQQRAHRPAEAPVANASAAARQPAVEQQRSSAERPSRPSTPCRRERCPGSPSRRRSAGRSTRPHRSRAPRTRPIVSCPRARPTRAPS